MIFDLPFDLWCLYWPLINHPNLWSMTFLPIRMPLGARLRQRHIHRGSNRTPWRVNQPIIQSIIDHWSMISDLWFFEGLAAVRCFWCARRRKNAEANGTCPRGMWNPARHWRWVRKKSPRFFGLQPEIFFNWNTIGIFREQPVFFKKKNQRIIFMESLRFFKIKRRGGGWEQLDTIFKGRF